MDEREALHTAARHYCLDHYPGLNQEVRERDQIRILRELHHRAQPSPREEPHFWEEATSILEDVLTRIERAAPYDFATVDDLRAFLLDAATLTAHEMVAEREKWSLDEDDERAMLEQLELYRTHVGSLSPAALKTVKRLPSRRPLTQEDADAVWQRLEDVWGAAPTRYWYPMLPPGVFAERPDVVAFDELAFLERVGWKNLRRLLADHGIRRVFQLVQGNQGDQCEMDVTLLEVREVDGREAYWTSEGMDWLLYVSHEQSLTVAGEWLLGEVKRVWPSWERGLSYYQTGKWPEW